MKQSSSDRQKSKQKAKQPTPELPELPEVSELPEAPKLPEVPELPEAPKIPELPKVGSDLVAQARKERMAKEGGWPFRPEGDGADRVENRYYNQQLSRYVVLPLLAGGGLAAFAAAIRALKSAPPSDMIRPSRVTGGPMTIDIPIAAAADDDDDEAPRNLAVAAKTASTTKEAWLGEKWGPPPDATESSMLTTKWAPMWLWPGAAALMYGGYEAGDLLGRYINKKRRKYLRKKTIATARSDYDDAIKEQREAAKAASYEGEIDDLFDAARTINDSMSDALEKESEITLPLGLGSLKTPNDLFKLPFGEISEEFGRKFAPAISRYAGTLGIMAVLAGIPSGMLVYNRLRQHPKQDDLTEAIRRRRAEMARRRPSPIQLELSPIAAPDPQEVLQESVLRLPFKDEDEDDAITPADV